MDKKNYADKLKEYLTSDKNVLFAFIFGSFASKKARVNSDLDVAVYFKKPPKDIKFLFYLNTLSKIAGKDVHLLSLNSSSPIAGHQVMRNKINLVIKDEFLYTKFREKIISDYEEYKYIAGMNSL